ncbi:hypothetical protein KJ652_00225 [Patescibacteria group bacterium]|nr:hypothetical protein [Patescibacteria group bacterium]MBU1122999.1 hypothetical protein [Patescibacteria group bacterium]MBU1911161.1 hypothetical protein [Patescibacteria group bacterium]
MLQSIHRLSGLLFFLLGSILFAAYLMMHNGVYANESAWWLQRADLPFALVTVLFAGSSLFKSLNPREKRAPILAAFIVIPLIAFFVFVLVLNFWEVLGLPTV